MGLAIAVVLTAVMRPLLTILTAMLRTGTSRRYPALAPASAC
jgi:hypothetical protein